MFQSLEFGDIPGGDVAVADDRSSRSLSELDRTFMARALEYATIGFGHTFPNPAVGCVLVDQRTNEIVGAGFHPKAGYPHAEIFALLEASGHVENGVEAARSVLEGTTLRDDDGDLEALMKEYTTTGSSDNDTGGGGGPEKLFGDALADIPVTAYVTLEPCCHYGKTPPCASSLLLAKVDRVVVGFRDPNPRVDGGGVKVLEDAGILVDMAHDKGCAKVVDSFVQRILPKDYDAEHYSHVTGVMRRGLRKIAGQKKTENSLQQVSWSAKQAATTTATPIPTTEDAVNDLELPSEWMENLDELLWKEELVKVRLSNAVKKKKLAKRLGTRVASCLGAHVAQVVGHTVLLYRPAIPPVLDLESFVGGVTVDEEELLLTKYLELLSISSSSFVPSSSPYRRSKRTRRSSLNRVTLPSLSFFFFLPSLTF